MANNNDGLFVGFWQKDSGNLLSHGGGLTPQQIKDLQELKPGDRLILWANIPNPDKESAPTHSLKIYKAKAKESQEF